MSAGTARRSPARSARRGSRRAPGRWSPRRIRHPWRWLAGLIGTLALTGAALWILYFSAVLGVREVQVSGEQTLSAEAIREIAAIGPQSPLARLDSEAVAGRVGTIPQVESVTVTRSWPSTVRIELVERSPRAVVETDTGWWLVDRFGVLFAQVSEPPPGVPPLEVDSAGPEDRSTLAAISVLDALPGELREQVQRLSAQSPDSVVLHLAGGRTVIWGSARDSARKARVLTGLLGQEGATIDVSSPSAVVIR